MKYAIIISPNTASQNIKKFLEEFSVEYHEVEKESIYCENLDERIDGDVFIFATTHRSEKGVPSLTVHAPGNWSSADLGGKESELCVAPATVIRRLYLSLKEKFDGVVSLEVTHHGPYMKKPVCFLEIGCSEKEWVDPALGKIIGEVLKDLVSNPYEEAKTVIGIGGGHYAPTFNRTLEKTDYAVGHILPKYKLDDLNEEMLKQAFERNLEKVELVLLDWKGLGPNKEKIVSLLEKLGYPYEKSKKFHK
jgi:D-aminoacyl-tRNA deacylase